MTKMPRYDAELAAILPGLDGFVPRNRLAFGFHAQQYWRGHSFALQKVQRFV